MTVGFWTLASRVLGFTREILILGLIGPGPVLDAFVAAQAVVLSPEMKALRRDLLKMLGIADTAHRTQATKRAAAYLDSGGHEGTDI